MSSDVETTTVGAVLTGFITRPWDTLGRRWHYKSAVLSSTTRSGLFFTTNMTAGLDAALGALGTEFILRFATAGFYGVATQAFRRVEPPIHGTIGAMMLLPAVAHSLELVVHWLGGTPELAASLIASVAFTALSTAFNLFAMRRGVLVVGADGASLLADLCRMPRLMASFLAPGTR
jgi:hypothetical protein